MPYAITPVDGAYQLDYAPGTGFPTTFRYLVMSVWAELKNDASGMQMAAIGGNVFADANRGALMLVNEPGGAPSLVTVSVGDGNSYDPGFRWFGAVAFDMAGLVAGVYYNFLVSIDSVANVIQCYVNDAALPPFGSPTWLASTTMAEPTSGPTGLSDGSMNILAANNGIGTNPCVADAWWGVPGAFFDLTIAANRRKFINADLTPVYLGANGELPLGGTPQVYATVPPAGVATDFLTNRGITGGTFVNTGDGVLCSVPPPATTGASLGELWFSNTSAFVDLTIESNRRKFISVLGGAQNLGLGGERPFGVQPPVFLSRRGLASTFAANAGRGGPFLITGDALGDPATDPPGSETSTTRVTASSSAKGVLGDYRNGNLYAFNPATLTDNGTRRRWVRRWRALSKSTPAAVSFRWLSVDMQTGVQVPDGTNPQLVLRWSDDGGLTWSNERIIAAGNPGQTTQTVKFNRLGMTRRFAGSDRIFELSSTDPFAVAIYDADLEAS